MEKTKYPHNVMVIAHPDDDACFAFQFQLYFKSFWTIICASGTPERLQELNRWQDYLAEQRYTIGYDIVAYGLQGRSHFNNIDNPEDFNNKVSSWDQKKLVEDLVVEFQRMTPNPPVILTHNSKGEYGHPHHIAVNRAVLSALLEANRTPYLDGIHTFGFGVPYGSITLTSHHPIEKVREIYRSQAWVVDSIDINTQTFNLEYL